jgi:hypothetical protein
MRPTFPGRLTFALCALVLVLARPVALRAQDEQPSLGDLARDVRKTKAQAPAHEAADPIHPIIDNDNLPEVMEDAKRARPEKSNKTVFSIDAASNTLKVSSPDVTCSLSFNARASALLVKPVLVEDLPLTELVKIDGPGSIQDENLQLQVFNGTDWDLREITIGLTLERKPGESAGLATRARVIPAAESIAMPTVERHSDVTLLYHLKAQAKPLSTTAFRENIGITPGRDEDWRWSIVEAKGIRPTQMPQSFDTLREEPLFAMPSLLQPGANQLSAAPEPSPERVPFAPHTSNDSKEPAKDKLAPGNSGQDNSAIPPTPPRQ